MLSGPMDKLSNLAEYFYRSFTHFDPKVMILNSEHYYFAFKAFLCWVSIYLFIHFFVPCRLEKKKDIHDTKTRYVSIMHASLVLILAIIDVLFYQSDKCADTNTDFQNHIMIISFSYFLYDLIVCIMLGCSDYEMVFHHIFVMVGYNAGLAYNISGNEMVRALIVTEVTCPIMHARMILKNYNLKHTKLHFVLDLTYMIVYLIARMGYGTIMVWNTLSCADNLLLVKIAAVFLWIQSILFSRRMLKLLKHRYLERKERKEKLVKLFWITHNKKVEELDYFKNALKKKSEYIP